MVEILKEVDISSINLLERSGMGHIRKVLETLGIFTLTDELDFQVMVLDELKKKVWFKVMEGKLIGFMVSTFLNS